MNDKNKSEIFHILVAFIEGLTLKEPLILLGTFIFAIIGGIWSIFDNDK